MTTQTIYLDVKAVCKMTGLGPTFVRGAIAKGELPAFKVGANVRLRHEDVIAWIEAKSAT